MPRYLARDYLTEFLRQNTEFFNRTVLTVPNENGLQLPTNILATKNLQAETISECTSLDLHELACYTVEKYDSPPAYNNNIIALDSDSDLLHCSGDSLVSSVKFIHPHQGHFDHYTGCTQQLSSVEEEMVQSIVTPSLCSTLLPQQSRYILEEFEDESEVEHKFACVSTMCKRLRPAKILDPFRMSVSSYNIESYQVCSSDQNSEDTVEMKYSNQFRKIQFKKTRELEEILSPIKSSNENPIDESIELTVSSLLKELIDFTTNADIELKSMDTKEEILLERYKSTPEKPNDEIQCMEIEGACSSKRLESPLSETCSSCPTNLPDISLTVEDLTHKTMYILSPDTMKRTEKKLRKTDASYGDMLLMLLPVCEDPPAWLPPPATPCNLVQLQQQDGQLDWEPAQLNNSDLKQCETVCKAEKEVEPKETVKFKKDNLKNVDTPVINDWKREDKVDRLANLPSLTNFTKSQTKTQQSFGTALAYNNPAMHAADENAFSFQTSTPITNVRPPYLLPSAVPGDKSQIFETTHVENSRETTPLSQNHPVRDKPLSSAKKLPEGVNNRRMMCATPQGYRSPLDSFMMLRTGKSKLPDLKKVRAFVKPVATVRAAKVRPIMKATSNQSLNKPQDISEQQSVISEVLSSSINVIPTNTSQQQTETTNRKPKTTEINSQQHTASVQQQTAAFSKQQTASSKKQMAYRPDFPLLDNHSHSNQPQTKQPAVQSAEKVDQLYKGGSVHPTGVKEQPTKNQVLVKVKLTAEYKDFLRALDRDSWSLMEFLREQRCVKADDHLLQLKPDYTRFLVKETEKRQEQTGVSHSADVLCGVYCLHALVQCVDVTLHCGLSTACGVMKTYMQEKRNVLRNSLEPVRQKLAKHTCQFKDTKIFHPKLLRVHRLISFWLKSEPTAHVLVLFNRYYKPTAEALREFLLTDRLFTVNFYPSQGVSQEEYMGTFHSANVILAKESADLQSCPWQFFQYVVQFEHRAESRWHETVFAEHPGLREFVALYYAEDELRQVTAEKAQAAEDHRLENISLTARHTVLCSRRFVQDKELLITLENKHSILLVVKEYKSEESDDEKPHPDVLMDERTCIVLIELEKINVRDLETKLVSAAVKTTACHVIVLGNTLTNQMLLIKLISLVKQTNSQLNHVAVKVHYALTVIHVASIIRTLCDHAKASTKVWSDEQWDNRQWLTEVLSKEEEFLLSYPFINSFCAQVMLKACHSLPALIQVSLEELKQGLKWIPEHVINAFYNANHYVVNNLPPTIPQTNSAIDVVAHVADVAKLHTQQHQQVIDVDNQQPVSAMFRQQQEQPKLKHQQQQGQYQHQQKQRQQQQRETNHQQRIRLQQNDHTNIRVDSPYKQYTSHGQNFRQQRSQYFQQSQQHCANTIQQFQQQYRQQAKHIQPQEKPYQHKVQSYQFPQSDGLAKQQEMYNNSNRYEQQFYQQQQQQMYQHQQEFPQEQAMSIEDALGQENDSLQSMFENFQQANNNSYLRTRTDPSEQFVPNFNTDHEDSLLDVVVPVNKDMSTSRSLVKDRQQHVVGNQQTSFQQTETTSLPPNLCRFNSSDFLNLSSFKQQQQAASTEDPHLSHLYGDSFNLLEQQSRQQYQQGYQQYQRHNRTNENSLWNQPHQSHKPRQAVKALRYDSQNTHLLTPTHQVPSLEKEAPSSVSLLNNKRRRLTYEKVPGAKNGQTRLTFL